MQPFRRNFSNQAKQKTTSNGETDPPSKDTAAPKKLRCSGGACEEPQVQHDWLVMVIFTVPLRGLRAFDRATGL